MIKVFLDASVVIAAMLSPTGGSAKIVEFVKQGKIIGILSQTVILEVEGKSVKIKKSRDDIAKFVERSKILVRRRVKNVEIEPYLGKIHVDDAHVVAGANLTGCDYLVTLDKKHLLRDDIRDKFEDFKIVSPKEMLEILVG